MIARPHFLVLNRFDDADADYERHVADIDCDLSFITISGCVSALGSHEQDRIAIVGELVADQVMAAAKLLAERHGPPDGVAALSEFDVLTAAEVRDQMGLPGPSVDLVRGFRDKVVMKRRVAEGGMAVPKCVELAPGLSADEVIAATGLPAVIKPRAMAGSVNVQLVRDRASLTTAIAELTGDRYECEEFISGEIYHVDGVLWEGGSHFAVVSGYLNTPLDYAHGLPLGSVTLDPCPLRDKLTRFAVGCVLALGMTSGCYHLELMRRPSGQPVFLEVGMRAGGAEIPPLNRDIHGIDLMTEAFRTALGLPLASAWRTFGQATGGWVVFPEPPRIAIAMAATSMLGVIPHVYAEALPQPGTMFDGTGGYWHVPGRFRLIGPDERSVRAAARYLMTEYRVSFEPPPSA